MPLLAAATGIAGLGSDGAAAPPREAAWTLENGVAPVIRARAATPGESVGGGIAGGVDCFWDNGSPSDCPGAPASQLDLPYPFLAEAADDFMLVGSDNPCRLTNVTFWVAQFGGGTPPPPPVDPATAWTGVQVTFYPDDGTGQPAGEPIDDAGGGVPGHAGSLIEVATTTIDMITVTLEPAASFPNQDPVYRIEVPIDVVVPKNFPLWIAISPIVPSFPQTALLLSESNSGGGVLQNFPLITVPPAWTAIAGAANCPDNCPYDCAEAGADGEVSTVDLLDLLAQWGATGSCDLDGDNVDTVDLLGLIGAWGACPPPPPILTDVAFLLEGVKEPPQPGGPPYPAPANDPCASATDVSAGGIFPVDMKGATTQGLPGGWAPECTDFEPDVWYSYTAAGPGNLQVSTDVDVFIEITDGYSCPPGNTVLACGQGGPLYGPLAVFVNTGASVQIRLINNRGYPDSSFLKGSINVEFLAGLANQECSIAEPLAVDGGPVVADTTLSTGTDFFDGGCPQGTFQYSGGGLWYEVVGPGPGEVEMTARLTDQGEFWDSVVSVFCGDCTEEGCLAITCVDSCQTFGVNGCEGFDGTFDYSEVTWCSTEGETYRILVHGVSGESGSFALEVTSGAGCAGAAFCGVPAPENDDCVGATDLGVVGTDVDALCVEFDTTCATNDGPDAGSILTCDDFGAVCTEQAVWYRVQAGEDGVLNATTCSTIAANAVAGFDTDVNIFGPYADIPSIDCGEAALTAALSSCNDDDQGHVCGTAPPWASRSVTTGVLAGEYYLVRVGGWGGTTAACANGDFGLGTICIFIQPAGACCLPDTTCDDTNDQITCDAAGGTFTEGAACVDVEPCP